jgi:hypothetical protein
MMVLTIVAILVCCLATWWGTRKSDKRNLVSRKDDKDDILYIAVQIICEDCSGDAEIPLRTLLTKSGKCNICNGRSYMLASKSRRLSYGKQRRRSA